MIHTANDVNNALCEVKLGFDSISINLQSTTRYQLAIGASINLLEQTVRHSSYFSYFGLIWWQTDKKTRLINSCKDLFTWTKLPNVWLIIGYDNRPIFNIKVNGISNTRYFAQLANANWNRLKFWFWDSYVDINLLTTNQDDAIIRK